MKATIKGITGEIMNMNACYSEFQTLPEKDVFRAIKWYEVCLWGGVEERNFPYVMKDDIVFEQECDKCQCCACGSNGGDE